MYHAVIVESTSFFPHVTKIDFFLFSDTFYFRIDILLSHHLINDFKRTDYRRKYISIQDFFFLEDDITLMRSQSRSKYKYPFHFLKVFFVSRNGLEILDIVEEELLSARNVQDLKRSRSIPS